MPRKPPTRGPERTHFTRGLLNLTSHLWRSSAIPGLGHGIGAISEFEGAYKGGDASLLRTGSMSGFPWAESS